MLINLNFQKKKRQNFHKTSLESTGSPGKMGLDIPHMAKVKKQEIFNEDKIIFFLNSSF